MPLVTQSGFQPNIKANIRTNFIAKKRIVRNKESYLYYIYWCWTGVALLRLYLPPYFTSINFTIKDFY